MSESTWDRAVRHNSQWLPEPSLDPPEDKRRVFADCIVCGEPIREFDDCYDIPSVGYVCEHCIERSRRFEVELND